MKIKWVLDSINYRRISRLLKGFYHWKGTGRKPYNLNLNLQAARACRFRKRNPSNGLFTQFRHRLGEETYLKIFKHLLRQLLESGV